MKNKLYFCFVLLFLFGIQNIAFSQNGIFILRSNKTKLTKEELASPQRFEVLISFEKGSSTYSLDAIDILDSAFNISFSQKNPRFYKVTMTGYDDGEEITEKNNTLAKDRTEAVYRYFTSRCKAEFMTRTAPNTYFDVCAGEQQELLKYRVPADFKWVSLFDKSDKERMYNPKIPLEGKVVILFEDDKAACLGSFTNCYVPRRDTIIRSPYSTIVLNKGCLHKIEGTKDECNTDMTFTVEEHLDYKNIVENYFLIPHQRQIFVQTGYIVLRSNRKLKPGECKLTPPDSIFVRFAATEDQVENQIRIIGKVHTEKGTEFRALKTKKIRSKITVGIEAAINATQIDTIFIGKRIQPEELSDYFYPAKANEPGAFEVDEKYYKAYKVDKYGEYSLKKRLEALFRINPEEDQPQDDDEEVEE